MVSLQNLHYNKNSMRRFEFNMALSAEKTHSLYAGRARYILVESDDGLKLQLPASNFRPFVTIDGIHGRFRVRIDNDNRIVELRKL